MCVCVCACVWFGFPFPPYLWLYFKHEDYFFPVCFLYWFYFLSAAHRHVLLQANCLCFAPFLLIDGTVQFLIITHLWRRVVWSQLAMTSIIWRKGAQRASWSSGHFHFSRRSWGKSNVRNHSLWNLWKSQSTFHHSVLGLCLWAWLFPGFLVFSVPFLGEQVGFLFNNDKGFACDDVSFLHFLVHSYFPSKRHSDLVVTSVSSGGLRGGVNSDSVSHKP